MTCEKRAQKEKSFCALSGHRAQMGHRSENRTVPLEVVVLFILFLKRAQGTDKEGGIAEMENTMKTGQKEGKRGKIHKTQQSIENLCPVPFPKMGVLA